jgi:TMEM175 potassium channel family protein
VSEPIAVASSWNKARIEALSDGIFAIVMTLLVLELKVPDLPRDVSGAELWRAVAAHGFTFFSFYLTFALAGLFWFWHHVTFHYISHVDGTIVWINLAFLMFVSLLPYSTAMLGAFTLHQPVSLGFYFGNQLALGLLLNAQWQYARARGLVTDRNAFIVRRFERSILAQPVACAGALAVLFVSPRRSFVVFAVLQGVGAMIARVRAAKAHRR